MDVATRRWWSLLRAIALLNIALWTWTARAAPREDPVDGIQLGLAGIYVLVCAFRSFFPRVDLERIVLIDHPLSNITLGRSAATLAELAFTAQLWLFVDERAAAAGLPEVQLLAAALLPVIALAQLCCWLGVWTLDHGWHAAEELLWGLAMGMLALCFVALGLAAGGGADWPYGLGLLGCALAAGVMLLLDVPMYLRRRREEQVAGHRTLAVTEGLRDALHRRVPTGAWSVWRQEVGWMTPYFSAAVWLSIGLVWL